MLDILSIIFFVCIFYQISFKHNGYNSDYISYKNIKPIKGLFALVVILHHITQSTTGGVLIRIFRYAGDLAVAVFFFFSGYGLLKSYMEKEGYREGFLRKRIPTVLVPYLIIVFIYCLLNVVEKTPYTVKDVLLSFVNGHPVATYSWFVLVLLLFYMCFYILMTVFKKNYTAIIFSGIVFCIIWAALCIKMQFGFHWYNSCMNLVFGMAWALWEKTIVRYIQKNYWMLLFICLVLFAALYQLRNQAFPRTTRLLMYWGIGCVFVTLAVMLLMKCRINNGILYFMGEISFELYMIHGAYMKLYRGNNIYIENEFVWTVMVLASAILSAYLLHKLFKGIR